MQRGRSQTDYEPVIRSRRRRLLEIENDDVETWPTKTRTSLEGDDRQDVGDEPPAKKKATDTVLIRGHALTYAGLFLFTIVIYARPSEFYPSPLTNSLAFFIAVVMLAIYVPSQIAAEGTLTARPREVNLILLFCLTGLLSIPLAVSPWEAWATFSDTFIRCVIVFIVMVNVVRTEARLKGLLFLALAVSVWLSVGAINDYRLGLTVVEGYRVGGSGSGIFGNSNDMALHLVTIVPIAIALVFATRGVIRKVLYGVCAALMMAAIVLTYSRGGFIGLIGALCFLAWKLGRRHRLSVTVLAAIVIVLFLVLAPGNYAVRLLSIFVPSLDPVGSADARRAELFRSVYVAIHNPVVGVGMGNYASWLSYSGQVTHNTYTAIAAEMGLAALTIYMMFVVAPFRRLGQVARETFAVRDNKRYYYLSVGIQASLLGYMLCTLFASVAYLWYIYYLVGYAVCLRRLYEADVGESVVLEKRKAKEPERGERRTAGLVQSESAS